MQLPWRDVELGGRTICTSITEQESEALLNASTGGALCLEIGSAFGYSARLLTHNSNRYVVAVDPHEGYGSLPGSLAAMRGNVDRRKVMIVRAQSWEFLPALARMEALYDFIFIDGDHRYETVKSDIEMAWGILSLWGTLAIHDYGEDTCPGVKQAVDEWMPDWVSHELVDTLMLVRR